jgi:hypothetical protein
MVPGKTLIIPEHELVNGKTGLTTFLDVVKMRRQSSGAQGTGQILIQPGSLVHNDLICGVESVSTSGPLPAASGRRAVRRIWASKRRSIY